LNEVREHIGEIFDCSEKQLTWFWYQMQQEITKRTKRIAYSGSKNIQEFQSKVKFIKQTRAGQIESSPHIYRSK
jgi:hypothetical protein